MVLACLVLATGLASCAKAGDVTCAEYAEMPYLDRESTLKDLLGEHRLEEHDIGNNLGLLQAVDAFCGTWTSIAHEPAPAEKNQAQPIDQAVDWESEHW